MGEPGSAAWKRNTEHRLAQAQGRSDWYSQYTVRIAKVERAYGREGLASS
ncbi:MAG: hypothetical protein ACREPV_07070 [Lysobacter sp.]